MDSIFVHDPSVIAFAHQLVLEYDQHQREQATLDRKKLTGDKLSFKKSRWYSDDRESHGLTNTTEYTSWSMMKQRCFNPRASGYKHYGARGITVCAEWKDNFVQFLKDMGPKPNNCRSLDRIDIEGNYEPGNCRWATHSEQMKNRRKKPNADTEHH